MSVDLSRIFQGILRCLDTEFNLWLRALCQAQSGGLTKWIIQPQLLGQCVSFGCVCWAIAKRTGLWAPARCIDPANQLCSSIISGASTKNNHCLNVLSVCCPFGCSAIAWLFNTASYWIDISCMAPVECCTSDLKDYSSWQSVYARRLIFSL